MIVDLIQVPALIFLIGSAVLAVLPAVVRKWSFLAIPAVAMAVLFLLPDGKAVTATLGTYELNLLKLDSLSRIFGIIFILITFIGGVYGLHNRSRLEQLSALIYGAGALGVTFAGDLFTLFIFWELMAISSTMLVWARPEEKSQRAGMRYLMAHVAGGSILLSGIVGHYVQTGSLEIQALSPDGGWPVILILLGVALNTALPPLHSWLPDAYPRATITGAVFMSAFTTKSAVYVMIRLFPGWEILIFWGLVMALYGVVYAVLANDIREILAYHIISQVGYMVTGVGIGTTMALNGAVAHAFSHILYKSLLFMGAGAAIFATGKSKLTELGGIASRMKVVVALYMIGAFSISGFPLFNGFISKSMVVSAAGEAHYEWVLLLLLLASVGTFLHTGLKLPYFTWFGPERPEIQVGSVPWNMKAAMAMGALLCTATGVYPPLLYNMLPYPVNYEPYTVYHLVETTQILIFTFIGFWILREKLKGEPYLPLDVDWLFRKPGLWLANGFLFAVAGIFGWFAESIANLSGKMARAFANPMPWLNPFASDRHDSATYSPTLGTAMGVVLLVFVVLGAFMLFQ
ncbi:MAG: Na(+)/H(+) antiporter subunit D [Spirochaetaceae bacterium]|nr:Na(+)/H(+) antiporter subunit D [Spirochaetaceae bacterium]|tara:strand:- start:444596 stop:446317 length:1722 start_codon:yes stop_codon:yes gene_type:complete